MAVLSQIFCSDASFFPCALAVPKPPPSSTIFFSTAAVGTTETRFQAMASTELSKNAHAQNLLDWLKPRRSVAIARLRKNGFALAVALVVTQLAPVVPSPLSCLWLLISDGRGMSGPMRWACWIGELLTLQLTKTPSTDVCTELAVFAILSANILQAYLGLKYPPPPCNPVDSPARRAQARNPPPAPPARNISPLVREA